MYLQVDIPKTLRSIPWFAELEPAQIERLASIATLHDLEPGDALFCEGDREDLLYVMLEGQMELSIEVPGHGQVVFFTAEALDIVGWSTMTPIVRQRTASARATQHCTLIGIQSQLLQQACDEDHELGYIIMRRLANVVANRMLTTRLQLMDLIASAHPLMTGLG